DVLGGEQEGAQLLAGRHRAALVHHHLRHLDHVAGEQRPGGGAEAALGLGGGDDVPVAVVVEVDVEALDGGAGAHRGELGGEAGEVVAVEAAAAGDELELVGDQRAVADGEVAA